METNDNTRVIECMFIVTCYFTVNTLYYVFDLLSRLMKYRVFNIMISIYLGMKIASFYVNDQAFVSGLERVSQDFFNLFFKEEKPASVDIDNEVTDEEKNV